MTDIPTIQLSTAKVLRDNILLRSVEMREEVVRRVRLIHPKASYESIVRSCRHIQNTLKMHRPIKEDQRYKEEKKYRDYYSPLDTVDTNGHYQNGLLHQKS